jgi:hypothetical protein
MKTTIMRFAALATIALCAGAASAASPTYCALYADEYVKHADGQSGVPSTYIHDRAYHKCLNLDDEPTFPTGKGDSTVDSIGGPIVVAATLRSYGADEVAVDEPTTEAPPIGETLVEKVENIEPNPTSDLRSRIVTSLEKWSPEWRAWCKEHYPNSFDPESGTVVPVKTGIRTEC